MRFEGVIKSWNDQRGFGFIEPSQGGQEIFVHIKALRALGGRPQIGQRVTFELELNTEGKKRAKKVEAWRTARAAVSRRPDSPAQWGTASYSAILAFVIFFLVLAGFRRVPLWVGGVYIGASILCYLVYAQDKAAALSGQWRVPESTLLMLGLAGGWPGAIVAQQVLRHKSNKAAFRRAFWATVVMNFLVLTLVASPQVRRFAQGWLGST